MDWVSLGVKFRKCCYFIGFRSLFEHVLRGFGIGPWTSDFWICRNIDISLVLEACSRVRKLWIVCIGVSNAGNVVISMVLELF